MSQLIGGIAQNLPLRQHPLAQVLVVDDDRDLVEAIVDFIESSGYTAAGVGSAREALDFLHLVATRPSLVLIDLVMPAMDGWELVECLRAEPIGGTALVAISGHASYRHRNRAPIRLLPKPLDIDALMTIVGETCGRAAGS